jgi:uncharacterized LabA/DUF88 family protein
MVFIDCQNTYNSARRTFHQSWEAYVRGQIDPLALGQYLADRNPDQVLAQVRVYRGLPDSTKQPAAYGANERQAAAWRAAGVHVVRRALQYPRGWPDLCLPGERPREKGIDVALAIDFVRLAIEDAYEVGILVSGDTDLKPALEVVWDLRGGAGPRPETAAWSAPGVHNRRLALTGRSLWCHWLDQTVYSSLRDDLDYTQVP